MAQSTKKRDGSVLTVKVREDKSAVDFIVAGAGTATIWMDRVSEDVKEYAMFHGFKQRGSDAGALGRDDKGIAATPGAKLAAIAKVVDHLNAGGAWEMAREGGGPGLDRTALAAVVEAVGKTIDEVKTLVAEGAKRNSVTEREFLAKLTTGARVKPIYDRMVAERTTAVDPDAELDAMLEPGEHAESRFPK